MKTAVIISDTHGHRKAVESLSGLFQENDYIIHLGDGAGDMREIAAKYPEKTYVCRGNCDFTPALPEAELEIEGVKLFFCHGHAYRVKYTLAELAAEAKRRGASVALYGHTHRPEIREVDGVTTINPGALKVPIEQGGNYCYLVIDKGKVHPVLVGDNVF